MVRSATSPSMIDRFRRGEPEEALGSRIPESHGTIEVEARCRDRILENRLLEAARTGTCSSSGRCIGSTFGSTLLLLDASLNVKRPPVKSTDGRSNRFGA